MARSASLGELHHENFHAAFVISTLIRSGRHNKSRHVGASHWPTQPSDNNIYVSENGFPSGSQNNEIEGGARKFTLSVRQGFSGKHDFFFGGGPGSYWRCSRGALEEIADTPKFLKHSLADFGLAS